MSYFAQINEDNIVQQVLKIPNYVCGEKYPESEKNGIKYIRKNGFKGRWLQAWYYGGRRRFFPSYGFIFIEEWDEFIPPQPYPSWNLSNETHKWEPPVPYPDDGYNYYVWDEQTLSWVKVNND